MVVWPKHVAQLNKYRKNYDIKVAYMENTLTLISHTEQYANTQDYGDTR
jgi:hypothetical protein